jgi:hypothetical protein
MTRLCGGAHRGSYPGNRIASEVDAVSIPVGGKSLHFPMVARVGHRSLLGRTAP